jgi:hypothetical protein
MALDWMPMGAPLVDAAPLPNRLRLLRGWNPDEDGPYLADEYVVEYYQPNTKYYQALAAQLRTQALANLGVWFVIQYWDDAPHVQSWRTHGAFRYCFEAPAEFDERGLVQGVKAVVAIVGRKDREAAAKKGRKPKSKTQHAPSPRSEWEKF